ncbi:MULTISPECIES: hypothetical protein [unclassified Roseitalea]|uniref:cell division protein FtsL n=1 Tax=unclassified Roseitalea TaxID=2639107 RepID=UPI00273E7547|nr:MULTISPECIES: hypothetical protein [unclassified Roseitalea]
MMRIVNVAMVGMVIAAATWTYSVKHESEQRLVEIRGLQRQIALEKETIELLRADWAHLSHPQRLQRLVELYADDLGLAPAEADQFISEAALPGPPEFDPGDAVGDIIAGEVDTGLSTGAIDGGGR